MDACFGRHPKAGTGRLTMATSEPTAAMVRKCISRSIRWETRSRWSSAERRDRGGIRSPVCANVCAKLKEATGGTVELAYVDQGYVDQGDTGKNAKRAAEAFDVELEAVRHTPKKKTGEEGVRAAAASLGGRENLRMAGSTSTARTRLRTAHANARRLPLGCLHRHPAGPHPTRTKCITRSRSRWQSCFGIERSTQDRLGSV